MAVTPVKTTREGAGTGTLHRKADDAEFHLPPALYYILSYLISLAPPLLFYFFYHADGAIAPVIGFGILVPLLHQLQRMEIPREMRLVLRAVLAALLVFMALLIMTLVSITTSSTYAAWFYYVSHGGGSSTVSYYFVIKFALFSAAAAMYIQRGNLSGPAAALGFLFLTVLAVMYGNRWMAAAALLLLIYAGLALERMRRSRWSFRVILALLQVVLLTFLIALLILPLSRREGGRGISFTLLPPRLTRVIYQLWPDFPLTVDIPGFGGLTGTRTLDGRPALSGKQVFEVEAPGNTQLHLKTQAFDSYNSSSWSDSQWMEVRSHSDPPIALGLNAGPFRRRNPGENQILISFDSDFYSSLPYTLKTREIDSSRELSGFLNPGRDGGYILARPFSGSMTLLLTEEPRPSPLHSSATASPRDSDPGADARDNAEASPDDASAEIPAATSDNDAGEAGLDTQIAGSATGPADISDDTGEAGLDSSALFYYLQVSPYIKSEVYDLSEELRGRNPHQTISNIQNYFRENYRYNLNYPVLGRNEDLVSHFLLESDSGYCVQFASAAAILLRILDIPSRYVSGYYVSLPADGTSVAVQGLNAHAWVEAWVEGAGWVTVEATPPMMAGAGDNNDYYRFFNPYSDSLTGRQLLSIMGRRIEGPEPQVPPGFGGSETGGGDSLRRILLIAALGIPVASIALGLVLLLVYILLPRRLRLGLALRIMSAGAAFRHLARVEEHGWRALLAQLELHGLAPRYADFEMELMVFLYSSRAQSAAELRRLWSESQRLALGIIFGRLTAVHRSL